MFFICNNFNKHPEFDDMHQHVLRPTCAERSASFRTAGKGKCIEVIAYEWQCNRQILDWLPQHNMTPLNFQLCFNRSDNLDAQLKFKKYSSLLWMTTHLMLGHTGVLKKLFDKRMLSQILKKLSNSTRNHLLG